MPQHINLTKLVVLFVLIVLALTALVVAYMQTAQAMQVVNIDATVAVAVRATLTAFATASSPTPTFDESCGSDPAVYPKLYRKYEADENAQILSLPQPALTPDAIANKEKAVSKMQPELVLAPCGVMDYFVFRGYSPFGLAMTAQKAAKQIKFLPAKKNGVPVPQRLSVTYEFYLCSDAPLCTKVTEVVE
ncbi:MAG: hypothetical protein IT324_23185 [Anaerolineae bacterium]|nr:hypothetical protein [Anaerolineae bacterium]